MKPSIDPFITRRDAGLLRALLYRTVHSEPRGDDEIMDLLDGFQIVDVLPGARVGIDSHVRYIEGASGVLRAVTFTLPERADPMENRISILSPVGRALVGRAPSDRVRVALPGDRVDELLILEVTPSAGFAQSINTED